MKKRICLLLACLLAVSICALTVSADKDPAENISLPAALLKGHTYFLAAPQTEGDPISISVNGQAQETPFVAEGTEAVIEYTAGGSVIGTYTLPVVDTLNAANHTAYFYDPSGTVFAVENEDDVELTAASSGDISFLNQVNPDNFSLNISFPESAAYQHLIVTLTDTQDAQNSLTFVIDPTQETMQVGEQTVNLSGMEGSLQLKYKNVSKTVYNGDTLLATCLTGDNGDEFSGFAGGAYLKIGFAGVSGTAQVNLTRLCNQALGHKGGDVADLTEPVVALTSQLSSKQYMGDSFNIPTYAVYDVYSPVVENAVTVELPDGTTAGESFTVSQYGRYRIIYTAEDAHGNEAKLTKVVFVNDDVAPTLEVTAMEKSSYALGETVTFPTYTASDNMENCLVDVILVLPNSEVRLLTHDASGSVTYSLTDPALYSASFRVNETAFKTEQTGTYTLRYVAYDDQFNKTVKTVTFTVE